MEAPAESTIEPSTPVPGSVTDQPITEPVVTDPTAAGESGSTETTEPAEPAEYADFVVPEGVMLDQALTTEFKSIAKVMGLKQEQAQQLTDMAVKLSQKFADSQQQAITEQRTAWEGEARADKEFGGEKFNENLSVAKKALDALASPELINLLNSTGLGSNPDMIRVFYRAGQLLSEDSLVAGTKAPATGGKNMAQTLYPDQA